MQNPSINEAIVIEVIILSGIGSFLAAGAIGIVVLDIRQNVCVVSRRCGPAVAFVPILIVSPQGACNVGRSCYLRNLAVLDHRAGRCHGDARHRHDSQPFPVSRGAEPEAEVSKDPNGDAGLGLGSGTPPLPAIQ